MGIFEQMKNAMQARSEAKRIQAEVEKILVEYSNGGITVAAKGDFSVASIKISPEAWAEASSGKTERFETMLHNVINGALKLAKKTTQEKMMSLMSGSNLAEMFGK